MRTRTLKTASGTIALAALAGAFLAYRPVIAAWLTIPVPTLSLGGTAVDAAGLQVAPYREQPTLVIPKLGITAPIVKGVPLGDRQDYDAALTRGVALAEGTAGLEAATGNSFIFGHSSSPSGAKGPYDTVFAALPSLGPGDELQLSVGGRLSSYSVTVSASVNADDVRYLAGDPGARTVTLLTCWPPGTSYKRWLVRAEPAG